MRSKLSAAIVIAVLVLSCAPALRVNYFPGARHFPPTPAQTVDLLRHEPHRPHDAFAVIRYDPPRGMSRAEVDWKLKQKGGAIGADALVIEVDTVYREHTWVGPYRPYRGRSVRRVVTRDHVIEAVAVRYR